MTETLASWHPFLVHFAVAISMLSAVLDIIDFLLRSERFTSTTFLLSVIAVPFLLIAAMTGNLASAFFAGAPHRAAIEVHETYANIAVWVFTAATFFRIWMQAGKRFDGLRKVGYVFIITAAAMAVFLAARKGGSIRHDGFPHAKPAAQSAALLVVPPAPAVDGTVQ